MDHMLPIAWMNAFFFTLLAVVWGRKEWYNLVIKVVFWFMAIANVAVLGAALGWVVRR